MGEFIGGNGGFCEMKISWRDTWRGWFNLFLHFCADFFLSGCGLDK